MPVGERCATLREAIDDQGDQHQGQVSIAQASCSQSSSAAVAEALQRRNDGGMNDHRLPSDG